MLVLLVKLAAPGLVAIVLVEFVATDDSGFLPPLANAVRVPDVAAVRDEVAIVRVLEESTRVPPVAPLVKALAPLDAIAPTRPANAPILAPTWTNAEAIPF